MSWSRGSSASSGDPRPATRRSCWTAATSRSTSTGRRVTRAGGTFPLTPTEVRLLHVMIAQMDRTVPTDTILNRVWSESDGADPSYVWVTIRRLRRKVEVDPDRPRFLLTERGVGYRLVSAPRPTAAAASSALGIGRPSLRLLASC